MDGAIAFMAKVDFGSFIEKAKNSAPKNIRRLNKIPNTDIARRESFMAKRMFPYRFNVSSWAMYREMAKGNPDVIKESSIM